MPTEQHIGVAEAVEETSSVESTTAKPDGDGSKRGTTAQAVTREHEAGWGDYFR